jgi:hypothetical protein
MYTGTLLKDGSHGFADDDAKVNGLYCDESAWVTLAALPQYRASKDANEVSYVWDGLIEHFIDGWRNDNFVQTLDATTMDRALKLMASTSRLARRQLGRMVQKAVASSDGRHLATSSVVDEKLRTGYGVVVMPLDAGVDPETYRIRRQAVMLNCARAMRLRIDTIDQAVILGLLPRGAPLQSEDLLVYSFDAWCDAEAEETRRGLDALGFTAEPKRFHNVEFPYPPGVPQPPRATTREQKRRLRQRAAAARKAQNAAKQGKTN